MREMDDRILTIETPWINQDNKIEWGPTTYLLADLDDEALREVAKLHGLNLSGMRIRETIVKRVRALNLNHTTKSYNLTLASHLGLCLKQNLDSTIIRKALQERIEQISHDTGYEEPAKTPMRQPASKTPPVNAKTTSMYPKLGILKMQQHPSARPGLQDSYWSTISRNDLDKSDRQDSFWSPKNESVEGNLLQDSYWSPANRGNVRKTASVMVPPPYFSPGLATPLTPSFRKQVRESPETPPPTKSLLDLSPLASPVSTMGMSRRRSSLHEALTKKVQSLEVSDFFENFDRILSNVGAAKSTQPAPGPRVYNIIERYQIFTGTLERLTRYHQHTGLLVDKLLSGNDEAEVQDAQDTFAKSYREVITPYTEELERVDKWLTDLPLS